MKMLKDDAKKYKKTKKKTDDYEVGYKKPPKSGQFVKGQSGNPSGRKKKIVPNSLLEAGIITMSEKTKIRNEAGEECVLPNFQILFKKLFHEAMNGNRFALTQIFKMLGNVNIAEEIKNIERKYETSTAEEIEEICRQKVKRQLIKKLKDVIAKEQQG